MIIAIDGPAASGKGTIARKLSVHYGLPHLDTGLLYRATARTLLDEGARLDDSVAAVAAARGLALIDFDETRLRGREMGEAASVVAALTQVRGVLRDLQRRFATQEGGAVLDGRDIGTIIAPDADVKIFVTADADTRAQRRAIELRRAGERVTFEAVLADIERRDARDAGRAAAPLRAADDAVTLDTSNLDVDAAVAAAIGLVERRHDGARTRIATRAKR